MTFLEVLEQVRGLLQSQGRISYRALKRQFALDDEYVADLRAQDERRMARVCTSSVHEPQQFLVFYHSEPCNLQSASA